MHITISSSFAVEMIKIHILTLVQIFNVYWQENKRLRRHQSPFNIPRKQCFIVSCDVMYIFMLVHACFLLEKIVSLCLARIIFFKRIPCVIWFLLWSVIYLDSVKELFHIEMYSMTQNGLALAVSRVIPYTHVSIDVIWVSTSITS